MSRTYEDYSRSGRSEEINSYLVPAILAMFCCFPLGILPLVFALQVKGRIERGDIAGARHSANLAKIWSVTFLGIAMVLYFVSIIVGLFYWSWLGNQPS